MESTAALHSEDAVDFMVKELGMKVEDQAVLKGYENKADTMFVTRLSSC